ncbi:MAG: hypothetical protein ABIN05_07920 [candidate division WOR-3 bacterium]
MTGKRKYTNNENANIRKSIIFIPAFKTLSSKEIFKETIAEKRAEKNLLSRSP